MKARTIASILVVVALGATALATQFEIPDWDDAVHFQVLASQDKVRPGDAFELALVATIRPGYHLYGPEEPAPSRTVVSVPDGEHLDAGEASYPAPIRRDLSGLGEFDLYEGEVAIRVPVQAAKSLSPGQQTASVEVDYQICTDYACSAPASDTFTIELEAVAAGASIEKQHPDIFESK